jgi:hypothetical protein
MKINISHNLNKAESKARVKKLIEDLKTQYSSIINNLQEDWTQDLGHIKLDVNKINFKGLIEFADSEIKLDINIPFFANIFRDQIKTEVENRINESLK